MKVEPPLLSPSANSSTLEVPLVDHLVKLEESEDVEGEPNRLVKCFKHQLFFFPPCLKYFAKRFYFKIPGIA